ADPSWTGHPSVVATALARVHRCVAGRVDCSPFSLRRAMNRLLDVSLALAAMSAVAAAQSPLHTFHGTDPGSRFGHVVRNAGDNNGDGKTDVAIGAPQHDLDAIEWDAGMVRLFSGADGRRLREYFGDHFQEGAGWCIANAGDVNGDGKDDLVYA